MKILIVGAVVVALAAAAAWFWLQARWQRTKKTWCVILYLVSRDSNATSNDLDEKLDQVEGEIASVPCASFSTFVQSVLSGQGSTPGGVNWEDVHLVYRALWNTSIRPTGKPKARARVVSWRPKAPIMDNKSFATTSSDDRDGFFRWAYKNCPAEHYAVFYWGHSLGPGGLFKKSESIRFPHLPGTGGWTAPASLIDVAETLRLLLNLRQQQGTPVTTVPSARIAGPGVAGPPVKPAGGTRPAPSVPAAGPLKAEVVLFQDCWMSTLETAFELQDLVRYAVASQSIVPIGYGYVKGKLSGPTGPVWPYTNLIAALLAQPNQFVDQLMAELQTFYDQKANRLPFPVVPFTLLDLGRTTEIATLVKPPIQSLVRALNGLDKPSRELLFDDSKSGIFSNPSHLEWGEWALVDVLKLCEFLKSPMSYAPLGLGPTTVPVKSIRDAATCVADVVGPKPVGSSDYSLVKRVFESPTNAAPPAGFRGVSVLWIPGPGSETPEGGKFIAPVIDGDFYEKLKFVQETSMVAVPPGKTWKHYAFEQTE
jgi:hypothetical protein